MNPAKVRLCLDEALKELVKQDAYLLKNNVNERSISHCLAVYMKAQFRGWDVDCEYNRNHYDPKRLDLKRRKASDDDLDAVTVFPDIIVHHRGTDDNLLVVEVKKSTSGETEHYDIEKLKAFKTQIHYTHAAFVRLRTGVADVDKVEVILLP